MKSDLVPQANAKPTSVARHKLSCKNTLRYKLFGVKDKLIVRPTLIKVYNVSLSLPKNDELFGLENIKVYNFSYKLSSNEFIFLETYILDYTISYRGLARHFNASRAYVGGVTLARRFNFNDFIVDKTSGHGRNTSWPDPGVWPQAKPQDTPSPLRGWSGVWPWPLGGKR